MTTITSDQCIGRYTYDNFSLEQSPSRWRGIDGRIARHVEWLATQNEGWRKLGSDLIKITEYISLKSLFRGSLLESGYKRYLDSIKAYQIFRELKSTATPPPFDDVYEKKADRTFTHVHYFAIHEGQIWAKARYDDKSAWELIYFDGVLDGQVPVVIRADGCNLIVLDQLGYIHYKKVLREVRDGSKYQFLDKAIKDNWKPVWFTLPFISGALNLFTPKRLFITSEIQSWTVSNLGRYARYYEDAAGVKHDVKTCTTLYAIFHGCREIYFSDPWLPGGFNKPPGFAGFNFDHSIKGPSDDSFDYGDIDAAGSTIVLSGTIEGRPCFYTTLADFDTLGRHPLYHYTEKSEEAMANVIRFITPPNWKKQPPLPEGYEAAGSATIFQCGEGNNNRTLRIPVKDEQGVAGFAEKNITDQDWHFVLLHSSPNK